MNSTNLKKIHYLKCQAASRMAYPNLLSDYIILLPKPGPLVRGFAAGMTVSSISNDRSDVYVYVFSKCSAQKDITA